MIEGSVEIGSLSLTAGGELGDVRVAWQATDERFRSGGETVLLLHGYTNSHRFLDATPPPDLQTGWGTALVGPQGGLDAARFSVVSFNLLGSCYGTTGPASRRPGTACPYGADFPAIEVADQAACVRAAARALGIARIRAVIGYSFGGYVAYCLAAGSEVPFDRVAVLASAPKGRGSAAALRELQALRRDRAALVDWRRRTLASYGLDPERPDVRAAIARWAQAHDPLSLLALRRAAATFDLCEAVRDLPQRFLLLHVADDPLFPPPRDAGEARRLPRRAERHVLPSGGHLAPVRDPRPYAAALKRFLAAD